MSRSARSYKIFLGDKRVNAIYKTVSRAKGKNVCGEGRKREGTGWWGDLSGREILCAEVEMNMGAASLLSHVSTVWEAGDLD